MALEHARAAPGGTRILPGPPRQTPAIDLRRTYSLGGNVDDDDSCRLAAPDDRPGGDPALEPLADNGGPTLTHMPLAGSDAIDFGTGAVCPPSDQRGYGRGVDGDGDEQPACDSGAVEFLPEPGGMAGMALAALAALARCRNRIQRDR